MMQSRTHNCGQLRLADAGRSVKIVGWMENIREVSSACLLYTSSATASSTS